MKAIFFDRTGRLRSGWRAVMFFIPFVLISFALIMISLMVLAQFPVPESSAAPLRLTIPFAISAVVALLLGWVCGKFFEQVPYRSLGAGLTKGWISHVAIGCAVGAVAFLIALIAAMIGGGIHIGSNTTSSGGDIVATLASTFVIFAVGAASEETLFRGYLLQTFLRSGYTGFAVAMTAFVFASAHNANPDANGLSWLNTLLAGVWFSAAYLKTRDLWFPFGIHLAWNWLQGPVFGISVSGISGFAADPLFRATDNGPAWLTGGSYGIEGGLACTLALLISTAMIWFMPGVRADEELLALTAPTRSVS
jgi:membrane protease YdiL (CAAX protease family)